MEQIRITFNNCLQVPLANLKERAFCAQAIVERKRHNRTVLSTHIAIDNPLPDWVRIKFRVIMQKPEDFIQKVINGRTDWVKDDLGEPGQEILHGDFSTHEPALAGSPAGKD